MEFGKLEEQVRRFSTFLTEFTSRKNVEKMKIMGICMANTEFYLSERVPDLQNPQFKRSCYAWSYLEMWDFWSDVCEAYAEDCKTSESSLYEYDPNDYVEMIQYVYNNMRRYMDFPQSAFLETELKKGKGSEYLRKLYSFPLLPNPDLSDKFNINFEDIDDRDDEEGVSS